MTGQPTTIADLQAAWPQPVSQGVNLEVQWSSNDGIIIPAENSQEPAPATNVQVTGGQAHLGIPDDPGVLAEPIAFFRR